MRGRKGGGGVHPGVSLRVKPGFKTQNRCGLQGHTNVTFLFFFRFFFLLISAVERVVLESEARKRSWQDVWNPPFPPPLVHLLTHSSRAFAIYDGRVSRTCPIMCGYMWSSHQQPRSLAVSSVFCRLGCWPGETL